MWCPLYRGVFAIWGVAIERVSAICYMGCPLYGCPLYGYGVSAIERYLLYGVSAIERCPL